MNTTNNTVNDVLVNNINDLTGWIKQSAESVGTFAAQQTPLYVNEYISWCFYEALLLALWGIFLILLCIPLVKAFKLGDKWNKQNEYGCGCGGPIMALSVVAMIAAAGIGFIMFASGVEDAVKVKVAPRVVLVDKVLDITKNKK